MTPQRGPHLSSCLAASGVTVRAPGPDDAPFLAALYASTRPDLAGSGAADPAFVRAHIAMQQRLQAADYAVRYPAAASLVLATAGVPCGRMVIDDDALRVRLVDLALLPHYHGRGLGTAVLLALQLYAGQRQLPLTLAVQRANLNARRLYIRLGFVPSAESAGAAEELAWRAPGTGACAALAH